MSETLSTTALASMQDNPLLRPWQTQFETPPFDEIRPEHFLPKGVQNGGPSTGFSFKVTRVENLGADRLIYGVLGGAFADQKVIARLPSTVGVPIEAEKTYDFAVEQKELKFFDAKTELRAPARLL